MTIAIDGLVNPGSTTGTISFTTGTLTTTGAATFIVVLPVIRPTSGSVPTVSSITATGLTFTKRTSHSNGTFLDYEIWSAPVSGVFSNTITVNASSSFTGDWEVVAFGVSGVSGFDTNVSLPATVSGNGDIPSRTISTDSTADFLLATYAAGQANTAWTFQPAGFTLLTNVRIGSAEISVAYLVTSSQQTSTAVTWGNGGGNVGNYTYFVDAMAATPPPATNLNVANSIRETLYAGTAKLKVAGNIRETLYAGTATLKIAGTVRETLRSGADALVVVNSYPSRSRTYRIR